MIDIDKTKHYSKNWLLVDGLKKYLPENGFLIEPFYGEGSLEKVLDLDFDEYYDICLTDNHYRDTLKNPPNYEGKWVITNPPYLAKNKAKNKELFQQYDYDDLYKIAISTMLSANGGILIIPINFFTDERSGVIRKKFFSNFEICRLNIYLDSMFENTNYNVCSFFFRRKNLNTNNLIQSYIYEDDKIVKEIELELREDFDYRIGGEFFSQLKEVDSLFSRITEENRDNPTHINVVCIDTKEEPLHFYYSEKPYYGKQSDRNIATLSFCGNLDNEEEIIEEANKVVSDFRNKYYNLVFTNYRDRNRKRIGFYEACKILTLAYKKLNKG